MLNKPEWKAWDKSCSDCALKRGYKKEYILSTPYPFQCVHRQDSEGRQHACAAWKDKIKEFQDF